MIEKIPGYCTLCKSRCGVLNSVEHGRLVAVEPLPSHPTGRAICAKGRAAPEIALSALRLTQPLRRTQPKGAADPGWEPISWDEALDTIAMRLSRLRDEHGAESVAFSLTSPSATPIVDSFEWIERFVALFGSPNVCNATEICNWHKDFAHAFTFGGPLPPPDFENSGLILLWGHNPSSVWLAEAGEIAEAVRRGARLAVIDPRRTAHARAADHWLAVRPGTDAALALGLAHLLITRERYDREFLLRWTNAPFLVREDNGCFLRGRDVGFADDAYLVYDELAQDMREADAEDSSPALFGAYKVAGIRCQTAFSAYAARCAAFPVSRVAAITGVSEDAIIALAQAIGEAKSVSHAQWTGVGQGVNATQTSRAIAALYALTGDFDKAGGNVVPSVHASPPISDPTLLPEAQRRKALGASIRPLGPAALGAVTSRELYDAILDGKPYPIRALMTFGANLLLSRADTDRGLRALQSLEFNIHCDLFETPTGRQADILLPVSGPWEREALRIGFEPTPKAQEWVQLRRALTPPVGQSRSDAEIVCALSKRLGFADRMFGGDIEAGWRHRIEPLGLSLDALRANPAGLRSPLRQAHRKYAEIVDGAPRGFATETRRVEIYSELLHRHGQNPLPDHAGEAGARTTPEFPLLLTCAKSPYFCHSQHRGIASLRRRARAPSIAIAPSLASRRAIKADEIVTVRTRSGEARFQAKIDADLAPDVVVADFGWWQAAPDIGLDGYDPFSRQGANYNRLIDSDVVDPVSGAPAHKAFPCEITRASDQQHRGWPELRELVVRRREHVTRDIVLFELAASDGSLLPPFDPGQHIGVAATLPGDRIVRRSYSLCGATSMSGAPSYQIAVKRIAASEDGDEGLFSSWCMTSLREGQRLRVAAPSGSFLIPRNADFPIALIAGGIGITPFLSLLRAQSENGSADITLYYANRNGDSHAFRSELDDLVGRHARLRIVNMYSRPNPADRASGRFDRAGRISADCIDDDLIRRRARFYLCGPERMMTDIAAGLRRRGVPAFEIFSERFHSPRETRALAQSADIRHNIAFARSGVSFQWSGDQGDLLSFAEARGLPLPSGCRVGQCESCSVRVLSGSVSHLSEIAELDDDVCLACQAIPASDLVLDA